MNPYCPSKCPKCGCRDIRDRGYFWECFKCGHSEKHMPETTVSWVGKKPAMDYCPEDILKAEIENE